ncbi:uncharacterized protein LOC144883891 [Branchiostoma floridae x Branchiostoma japonicum]
MRSVLVQSSYREDMASAPMPAPYLRLDTYSSHCYMGRKMFKCPHCSYETNRRNNLKRHISTMHLACTKSLECCDHHFNSKAELREHVYQHHRYGYTCKVCGRNFCRKALLKRHQTVHSGRKDFVCGLCGYATSHKSNLERHKKIHRCPEDGDEDDLEDRIGEDQRSVTSDDSDSPKKPSPPADGVAKPTDALMPMFPLHPLAIPRDHPLPHVHPAAAAQAHFLSCYMTANGLCPPGPRPVMPLKPIVFRAFPMTCPTKHPAVVGGVPEADPPPMICTFCAVYFTNVYDFIGHIGTHVDKKHKLMSPKTWTNDRTVPGCPVYSQAEHVRTF